MRYMLGRVAFADDRHTGGAGPLPRGDLRSTAGFRGDPVLLSHVDTLLGEPRQSDGALDLLIEKIGAPAADLLEKVANDGTDLTRRQRAAAALDDIGEGKRVDQVSLSILELKKATSCEEKKVHRREAEGAGRHARAARAARAARPQPGAAALRRRRHALHEEGARRGASPPWKRRTA